MAILNITNWKVPHCTHLHGNAATGTIVMHEDAQHVWDELRQVKLEFSSQCHHYLLDQKDDGILHGVVGCPVLLQGRTTGDPG